MRSSPRTVVCGAIGDIIEWVERLELSASKRKKKKGGKKVPYRVSIPCSVLDLKILRDYVSIFSTGSSFSSRIEELLRNNGAWLRRFEPPNYRQVNNLVVAFLQDLKELFRVSGYEDDSLKKNVLVAGFMNFLLQLLQGKAHLPGWDARVIKDLRFINTILWDTPFQATEHEHVHNFLAEFEEVANEAGRFVHSLIFCPQGWDMIEEALLHHISLFKDCVIEFLNLLPNSVAPKAINNVIDSFFILDSLLYDLDDLLSQDGNPIVEVKDQIQMLHQGLLFSWSLLKEHLDTKELKEIMVQMRDIAYEVEYLVNSFLVGDAPVWYLSIRFTSIIHNVVLIGTRLQEMMRNHDHWAFEVVDNFDAQLTLHARKDYKVDDIIVGFEDEEKSILDQLVGGTQNLQIISIFGMPGLGKTTLAKMLYNHPYISQQFDKCSWCVVSQWYQRKSVLFDVLTGLESEFEKVAIFNMDDESMGERIYKTLKGRTYLIVLDDVWNASLWEDLRRYFPNDRNGSRILLTSRNKDIAPSGSIIYALPFLSNEQCWELLEKKVFHNEPCPPPLQGIGEKIAANCKGLPLSVVVTAGILSTMDKEPRTWDNVRQTLDSYILSEQNTSVMQILELSYKHLPQHLKPCFLYFGVFQNNVDVDVKKLIQLWTAEGFICKVEGGSVEIVAEKYLMELIDKSLIMVARKRSDGCAKVCIMHDLLRDLCLRIAEKENFLKVADFDDLMYNQKYLRIFHQSSRRCLQLHGPYIRSVFCACLPPNEFLNVVNMKLLRVLDSRMGQPPYSDAYANTRSPLDLVGIENLVHLRYLAIKRMPTLVDSYVNLEFLIVDSVVHLSQIVCMVKLRYLRATRVYFNYDFKPNQIKSLEYLSKLHIMKPKDEQMLQYLPNLRKLRFQYEILRGKRVYRCSDLSFLTQLESLTLYAASEHRIAEIKFPPNIKKLNLGSMCLLWKKIEFPSSIIKLKLDGIRWTWDHMSMIGTLPNLEVLKLNYDAFVDYTWYTSDDEFQQLKVLELRNLDLVQWNVSSSDHFPNLQRLFLESCSSLEEIPPEIGDIATLQLIEVHGLCQKSVVQSATDIQQQQEDMGNEDLSIIFRDLLYIDDIFGL